ncbi:MAG TPA: LytTR family DNA-binding domain-containing protein [Treponemataceae bacterium]|nr:LytTR family DNA-binding domain-containing protein [Treponemataceae bacterium]
MRHFVQREVKSLIKIGVCDDEASELKKIATLIEEWGRTNRMSLAIQRFTGGEALLAAIGRGERFDILFLDIYMGEKDGIAVAGEIRKVDEDCAIVFATSARDRAIEGFGVRAIHYLLKPIEPQALADALDRALRSRAPSTERFVQVEARHRIHRIALGDIRFAESRARVVTVHTRSSGDISYYDKLDNFERLCDDERFLRCHKSFLVNLDYAQTIANVAITLDSGEEVPISKGASDIKARFASHVAQGI